MIKVYQHVFSDVTFSNPANGLSFILNHSKCKYCGYIMMPMILNSTITPSCISDEEKIIKDIIE